MASPSSAGASGKGQGHSSDSDGQGQEAEKIDGSSKSGAGVAATHATSTSGTTAASALPIPSPLHLSVGGNIIPGGLSPLARHTRGAFDSTPSFSSPLAYASTLPIDQTDDFDIDSSAIAEDDETASRQSDTSRNSDASNTTTSGPSQNARKLSSALSQAPIQAAEAYYSTDEEMQQSLLDTPTPKNSASARRERSTSARARLLAWDKQDAASQSKAGLPTIWSENVPISPPAIHSRRKSNATSSLMGPPLTIPRKASTGLSALLAGASRNEPEGLRRSASGRVLSGMSDDSQRSISTASIASTDSGSPSSSSWQIPKNTSLESQRAVPSSPQVEKATPSRRMRANTHASISSAHRRAKSLGGSLLGDAASPIGGPDGVDPDLVAAIRAGDSSIPSPLHTLETSISRMSLGGDNSYNLQGISPTSRIASLPSTTQSSTRQTSTSRRPVDHLSVIPDTRALASSYPSLQIPRKDLGSGNDSTHVSPTDVSGVTAAAVLPPEYSRNRVRSQTMSPASAEVAPINTMSANNNTAISTSYTASSPTIGFASRANAPLGDAIRLQKVPSNIRVTGDYNSRNETSNRLHPLPFQSSNTAANVPSGHGLGIGMPTSPDSRLSVPPQTPSVTRNTSPMISHDTLMSSTSVSSGSSQASPALFPQSTRKRELTNSLQQTNEEPSPLTVSIPLFTSQDANLETLSAMPALSYRSALSSPSSGRMSATMGPPPLSLQSVGPLSASQSAFAPLLAMPSPQSERPRGPRGSIFSDDDESNDACSHPAPWIASSQEVRRGSSNSTLKAALTQRNRASMSNTGGSGQFDIQRLGRVNSNSKRDNRRTSAAPLPQGTDEYARIIVQSRNAKMQKWRPSTRQQSPNVAEQCGPSEVDMRASLRENVSSSSRNLMQPWEQQREQQPQTHPNAVPFGGLSLDRAASADQLASAIATPNVSPAASEDAHHQEEGQVDSQQISDTAGRREIEWVDWLDEYTKLKEAKLRSEREEMEKQRQEEEEAEVSMELDVLPISQAATTPTTATFKDFNAQPTLSRSSEVSTLSLSQNLSSSLGLSDAKQGHRPRRPSEMPRFTARQEPFMRRSSSNVLFPNVNLTQEVDSGTTSSMERRGSFFGDKSRTLSLSPINSRLPSSGSQSSNGGFASTNMASSNNNSNKRRKILGGKIEAWWGAVKSGFAGNAPPSIMGAPSIQQPMSASFGPPQGRQQVHRSKEALQQQGQAKSANREVKGLNTLFTTQGFGSPHHRSSTVQAASPSIAETKPINVLRSASSAQNLRSDVIDSDAVASSDGPSLRSDRSSTGTAHAKPMLQDSNQANEVTSPEILTSEEEKMLSSPAMPTNNKPNRKASHLSLHLLHGQSAFDAQPFEVLASSEKRQPPASAPVEESTMSTLAAHVTDPPLSAPVNKTSTKPEARTLSDAWKPESSRGGDQRSDSGSNASPIPARGRLAQRKARAENNSDRASSKDITIKSIRQHIHNRLTASKEAFDRELKKIIHSINAYVEEALQEQAMADSSYALNREDGEEMDQDEEDVMSRQDQQERDAALISSLGMMNLEDKVSSTLRKVESPSGNQSMEEVDPDETPQPDAEESTEAPTPRRNRNLTAADGLEYTLSMPKSGRKPSTIGLAPTRSVSRSTTLSRKSNRHAGDVLSTSRSTSRSHSPMPSSNNLQHGGISMTDSPQYSPARRLRQLEAEDAPLEPLVAALQDLVQIAMEVHDTTIYSLTSNAGVCSEIISQVQAVGRRWDENPQWDGRGWYVQLLLAVAGLSRVVEWWEAEKGFWNFQDENETSDNRDTEPIRFIFGNPSSTFASMGGEGNEYSEDFMSSARSAVSASPTRTRQITMNQIMSYTPSQQSSAQSSPALEPWDRRVVSEGDRSKMSAIPSSEVETKPEGAGAMVNEGGKKMDGDSLNVVMELSVSGERFLYVSPAWRKVIGTDPIDILDLPIQDVLAPGDASTFAQATKQLQDNDSHTVEVAFRLQVRTQERHLQEEEEGKEKGLTYYQEMEGKGMLMHDRQSAMPSHTMWVFKPVGSPEPEGELSPGPQRPAVGAGEPPIVTEAREAATTTTNHQILISTEPLLCRICERDVPAWFFEKHSEICNEIHRLEMEISEYNEGLADLRRTIRSIIEGIEDMEANHELLQYRNIPLSTPAAIMGPPSALEVANRSISPRHSNPAAIRKNHLRVLDMLLDITRTAATISTPAVKDDTASDPIEKQRLISPDSDSKIIQVKNWKKMTCEEAALDLLAADVETAVKSKLSAVNRMLNTIVYVETVRMEWEGRVEAALADLGEDTESEVSTRGSSVGEERGPAEKSTDEVVEASASQERINSTAAMEKEANEDLEEKGAAAVLLDTYEPDLTRSTSTSLSAHKEMPGGTKEEDIPGVESQLGGSILENISPIPIPASQGGLPIRNPRQRRMTRDASSTSSLGLDNLPPGGLHVDTQSASAIMIKRDSLLSGDSRLQSSTPPVSPHHSPAELHSIRSKDRKLSMTHRMGIGGDGRLHSPHLGGMTPLSPRIPPAAPSSRPTASSIKDFDIIKPISKGAFGSVFLAKKRTTGDYYAIKVLKKSDMISKNQITNVKAERMILMTQTQSPFVVKLFFTFQSAEYLYLVMEYLPGGDCASLCKALGTLPEDWSRQYLAEVVNGLELLHSKGVVHRDMKPDNLLIDQKGHLKLTDFGLSKIGLLGRQNRQQLGGSQSSSGNKGTTVSSRTSLHSKKDSISSITTSSSAAAASASNPATSPQGSKWASTATNRMPETPLSLSIAQSQNFYVGIPAPTRNRIISTSTEASDSSGSESPMAMTKGAKPVPVIPATHLMDSPSNIFGSHMMLDSHPGTTAVNNSGGGGGGVGSGSGAQLKKFVGTPDYLAPESILGLGMDDAAVDCWALGVILYEFLYGFPPFHADTPEKVFDNILSRNIDWHEEDLDEDQVSPHARDLMEKLMCTDRKHRLGAGEKGASDIKNHPFFDGIDWKNLTKVEGPFVPQIADVESTDYFDLRGAVYQEFKTEQEREEASKEEQVSPLPSSGHHREFARALEKKRSIEPSRPPSRHRMRLDRNKIQDSSGGGTDDFGSFSYKNLPVLKQANDEVIKKMRGDQLNSMSSAMMDQQHHHHRHRSMSGKVTTPGAFRHSSILLPGNNGPPSPSTSISSQSSVPSKSTAPTSPSGIPLVGSASHQMQSMHHHHLAGQGVIHRRRPSELSSAGGGSGSGVGSNGGAAVAAGSPGNASNLASATLMERKRSLLNESDSGSRRSSMPTRLRNDSSGVLFEKSTTTAQPDSTTVSASNSMTTPAEEPMNPNVVASTIPSNSDQMVCLIAEDNPISLKMLEHVLSRLGCTVTSVRNGAEALRLAMGETKFAILFIDATLPIVNGQDVARMIKSTRNINSQTPIVALTTYDAASLVDLTGNVFDAGLVKPVEKVDVCNLLPQLGFRPLLPTPASGSASGNGPSESASAIAIPLQSS